VIIFPPTIWLNETNWPGSNSRRSTPVASKPKWRTPGAISADSMSLASILISNPSAVEQSVHHARVSIERGRDFDRDSRMCGLHPLNQPGQIPLQVQSESKEIRDHNDMRNTRGHRPQCASKVGPAAFEKGRLDDF